MIQKLLVVAAIALLILTGFLRDLVFVNINIQLANTIFETNEHQLSPLFSFLAEMDYWTTYGMKWVAVIVFFTLYGLETHLVLRTFFRYNHWNLVAYCYAFLGLTSGIIYGTFWLLGFPNEGYEVARYPLSWAQSPIPTMLLIPALYLRENSRSQTSA